MQGIKWERSGVIARKKQSGKVGGEGYKIFQRPSPLVKTRYLNRKEAYLE